MECRYNTTLQGNAMQYNYNAMQRNTITFTSTRQVVKIFNNYINKSRYKIPANFLLPFRDFFLSSDKVAQVCLAMWSCHRRFLQKFHCRLKNTRKIRQFNQNSAWTVFKPQTVWKHSLTCYIFVAKLLCNTLVKFLDYPTRFIFSGNSFYLRERKSFKYTKTISVAKRTNKEKQNKTKQKQ